MLTETERAEIARAIGDLESPYNGPVFEAGDSWKVQFNPAATTVWVKRGPRYLNTETGGDTEPFTVNGVPYRVEALFEISDSGMTFSRLSADRLDRGYDGGVTEAGKRAIMDTVTEIAGDYWSSDIAAAMTEHRRAVDRAKLEGTRANLEAQIAEIEAELARLEAGERYNAYAGRGE